VREEGAKQPNRYSPDGRSMIEHNPENVDPFAVWDLALVFRVDSECFSCHTLAEAEELCERLGKVQQ
jgi:hypothetical protein